MVKFFLFGNRGEHLLKEEFSLTNSLTIHQVQTKEIETVMVFGYLILIGIHFYNYISSFSP